MNRERFEQIDRIFRSALERPAGERAAFVAGACAGDEELRREVESLIAHDRAEGFPEAPSPEENARLLAADESPSLAGRTLGPYRILEKIGAGGMGEVYLAQKSGMPRRVALKLLPAHFTKDEERVRRFQLEAEAASSLNHPNILTIHEIGQIDGRHFMETEHVEGVTLRARLRGGRMRIVEALDIAAQTAAALSAAHAAGIVHRDVKPENIMLRADGYVKVLDFGLAKLSESRPGPADTEAPTKALIHTETGVVMGTVEYMSPEQARALKVDARTDIFSLGVVLYEMAAGRAPFAGTTRSDVLVSILEREPPPLGRTRETPAELERILTKSLAKNREERYQSVKDLLIDLQMLRRQLEAEAVLARSAPPVARPSEEDANVGAAAVSTDQEPRARPTSNISERLARAVKRPAAIVPAVLILALATLAAVLFFRGGVGGGRQSIDSLAVLPFQNVSGDPDAEYLSDGITESLINSLSQLPNLKVMSRNSVFRFKGREEDVREVADALGVRAVLTGRIKQRGDSLSVGVELVDARDSSQIWGGQYNRKLADILAVQEEIATEISEKLRLRLSGEEQKLLTKRYTEDTEAYQLYLKCTFFWNKFTPEAERTAIDYCTQAIVKDPNFVMPYIGLVYSYQITANNGWARPHDVYPKANAAVAKALELDPNNYLVQDAMANNLMFYDWDWAASERGFRRTIEIEPNYWHSHELYSYLLSLLGRHEEAFAEIRRAQELDPLSLIAHVSASNAFYRARQYDRSIEQVRKALELNPDFPIAHRSLARSYAQQGKYEEAIAAYKLMINSMGRTSQALGELGYIYAMSGKRAEALKLLDELKEMSASQYVSPLDVAFIYIGLGDKEQAFAYLEQSYQERSTWLMFIKVDPRFDPLRPDPRFAELLRRMKLSS